MQIYPCKVAFLAAYLALARTFSVILRKYLMYKFIVINNVMGYETSKLITSDTDLERGNAQRERWKIATTCWSPRVYVIQRTNGCESA